MKQLRKWSRILHRDIGYFFIGATNVDDPHQCSAGIVVKRYEVDLK